MNRHFRVLIIAAALVLTLSCVTYAAEDVFVNDEAADNTVLTDNTNITEGVITDDTETLSGTIEALKGKPDNTDYYKTAARLYANNKDNGFKVFTDGSKIDFSKYDNILPVIEAGRTLIPIRAMSEAMGASVDYNSSERLVTITLDDKIIKLTLDFNIAKVNGEDKTLDVPAKSVGGRTMIPLRFVGEAFGKTVGYEFNGDVKVIYTY